MEFQDFQRFTELFSVKVIVNVFNPGQHTHILFQTKISLINAGDRP